MKNNELDCNVIIDLLPLYNEGVCSEESRTLVENHIRNCEECRQLCENMTVPTIESVSEPSEAETFRKVNKKLKQSKFTKIMSVIFCIFLVVFGMWNVSWYFIDYRPYSKLCRTMTVDFNFMDGMKYYSSDSEYYYEVSMPKYLEFGSGFAHIVPLWEKNISDDSDGDTFYERTNMFVWVKFNGEAEYGVFVGENNVSYGLKIDGSLNLVTDGLPKGEDKIQLKIFAEHYEEIEKLMKAVQDKWGDNL